MKERLLSIIEQKKMTASQFADAVGIQRATLHHIITGRNNPSLDVVTKIYSTYPDLDLEWLITGQSKQQVENERPQVPNTYQTELFPSENSDNTIFPTKNTVVSENRSHNEMKDPGNTPQRISGSINYDKKITNIIVVYSDGTTESFSH